MLSSLGVTFTLEPVDTYSVGAANIVEAMHKTGVSRLAVVSSTAIDDYPGRTATPFALRVVQPVISRIFGKTLYADMRRMERIVADSGLDWTIVRPFSGPLRPAERHRIRCRTGRSGGRVCLRTDLADYLLKLAESPAPRATVTISTTVDTPSMWQLLRREAFKSA